MEHLSQFDQLITSTFSPTVSCGFADAPPFVPHLRLRLTRWIMRLTFSLLSLIASVLPFSRPPGPTDGY